MLAAALFCVAIDGDTLRCGDERVRLLGIDAPELAGHCRTGRRCVPGDGVVSRAALAALLDMRPAELKRFGRDRFGRTLAIVTVESGGRRINVGCAQLRAGHAVYVARWDNGRALAADCR